MIRLRAAVLIVLVVFTFGGCEAKGKPNALGYVPVPLPGSGAGVNVVTCPVGTRWCCDEPNARYTPGRCEDVQKPCNCPGRK